MLMAEAREQGLTWAPPYWEKQVWIGTVGTRENPGVSLAVRPIQNRSIWEDVFPGEIDWFEGWRDYWKEAGRRLDAEPETVPRGQGVEIQVFFEGYRQWSQGILVDDDTPPLEFGAMIKNRIDQVCQGTMPVNGLVGVLSDYDDSSAMRPGVTLMTSGPGGGVESALMILKGLNDELQVAGVATRPVRDDAAGVVKIIFAPELYLDAAHSSYGINWSRWKRFSEHDPVGEWGTTALTWCDEIARAVCAIREKASLMIDQVHFDFYKAVCFSSFENLNALAFDLNRRLELEPWKE